MQQGAKVANSAGAGPEQRKAFGGGSQDRLGVRGAVEQREEVVDFLWVETRALDVELMDGRLGIGQSSEINTDGSAARGRLRTRCEAKVREGFAGFREIADEAIAVVMRLEFVQLTTSHGARDVAPDELPQRFEFEDFRGGFQGDFLPTILDGIESFFQISTGFSVAGQFSRTSED